MNEDASDLPSQEKLAVELQFACSNVDKCPSESAFRQWARAAIVEPSSTHAAACDMKGEVTIRIVDCKEMQDANAQWREQDKTTNVLSFPAEFPAETGLKYYGDILVCEQVIQAESVQQGKLPEAHWAHMVVHGMLHLQGFDHTDEGKAKEMEQREVEILHRFGYPNPYDVHSTTGI